MGMASHAPTEATTCAISFHEVSRADLEKLYLEIMGA